jgi:hypothetical protein
MNPARKRPRVNTVPVLRLSIADLELVYALTAFMQSGKTDPDFMVFVDGLTDELPEVPAGAGAMKMIFSISQQAVNTIHCIAGYAAYIGGYEGEDEELGLKAAKLIRALPSIRETVVVEDADRDIA